MTSLHKVFSRSVRTARRHVTSRIATGGLTIATDHRVYKIKKKTGKEEENQLQNKNQLHITHIEYS